MPQPTFRTITGKVVKICSSQTIKIETKVTKEHPIYRKRYTLNKQYTAHDGNSSVKLGDIVTIAPCRPISKTKSWQVITLN